MGLKTGGSPSQAEKSLEVSLSLPASESLCGTSSPVGSKKVNSGMSMRALCWLNPCRFREESSYLL